MTPIEAMARALADYYGIQYGRDEIGGESSYFDGMARAALAALRDCGVTEGMKAAYDDIDGMGGSPEGCFRPMLDAALQEDSGSNGRPG